MFAYGQMVVSKLDGAFYLAFNQQVFFTAEFTSERNFGANYRRRRRGANFAGGFADTAGGKVWNHGVTGDIEIVVLFYWVAFT